MVRKQAAFFRRMSLVALPLMALSAFGQAGEQERSTLETISFPAVEEEQLSETSVIGVPAPATMAGDSPEQLVVPVIYSEEFVREMELERDTLRYFQLMQQEQQDQRQFELQRPALQPIQRPGFENRTYGPGTDIRTLPQ